jgi:ubiquinone/menaquinone biosynthesis C-methylase UbiE
MGDNLTTLQTIYDARAPTYDKETGFHPSQAADYLKWMSLKPGFNVLDLACGTGAISIPAARAVGPSGKVIGVDISSVSLSIARAKAEKDNLSVKFIQHDVSALQGVEGIEEDMFDIITCASAFVLLDDPSLAVKGWAKLLKKGGRLIFDVPTNDTMVKGGVLDQVAQELGIMVVYGRMRLNSEEKVRFLLTDAGLDNTGSFPTENYDEPEEYSAEKAGEIFDGMLSEERWSSFWYKDLAAPKLRGTAREIFCRKFEKAADHDGRIKSYLRFHMAVGKRV